MNPFAGILIFSAVETATVAVWGAILGVGDGLPVSLKIIATTVLFVGYTVEHIIAYQVGKGRALFSFPMP
jgi:hypothetical protein